MRRRGLTFTSMLVLMLLGCAGADRWTKDGASSAKIERDLDECEDEARLATRTDENIDADIMATRRGDWERSGALPYRSNSMAASNEAHGESVVARCMEAKGYSPRD
jgi:hypothetical protein